MSSLGTLGLIAAKELNSTASLPKSQLTRFTNCSAASAHPGDAPVNAEPMWGSSAKPDIKGMEIESMDLQMDRNIDIL
jgi:hypothetical protein